jgi:hypothetical protein
MTQSLLLTSTVPLQLNALASLATLKDSPRKAEMNQETKLTMVGLKYGYQM